MTTGVRLDPEFVEEQLKTHQAVFSQDVRYIRSSWITASRQTYPSGEHASENALLRSRSITFRTSKKSLPTESTPAAWHPFILGYCRTLGVDPDPIDRLFRRLLAGDVSDRRGVVSDSDQAMIQFDLAIATAHQQWLNGDPVIHTPTNRRSGNTTDDGESAASEPAEQVKKGTGTGGKTVKPKKSTAKGEARAKLISALTSHHQYSNGGCGEYQPISVNELSRQAKVAPSTASAFFTKQFQGHKKYQRGCEGKSTLITALKLLNDEFTPGMLVQGAAMKSDRKPLDTDGD